MGQTNLVSAESIEKLIQIGHMSGNININGNFNQIIINVGENVLSQIGEERYFPDTNYTDVIIDLISRFKKNQLLDVRTYQEIVFLLYLHPNPETPVNILFEQRPIPDLISMSMWIPFVRRIEKEHKILKSMGIDGDKKYEELKRAFEEKHDFRRNTYDSGYIRKISDEFMSALWKNETLAHNFVSSHPEILDLQVDQCLAGFTLLFGDEKEKIDFLQETRQFLHNVRSQQNQNSPFF